MMMVSIAVALIAVFYLFRENQKTKLDIKSLKDVPLPVNQQAVITPPKPILKKEKVQVPATSTTAAIADDSEQ